MSAKKSVFLATPTVEWVGSTTGVKNPEWSASINATFEQLRHLLRDALPELTQSEWAKILDAENGNGSRFRLPIKLANRLLDSVGALSLEDLTDDYAALVRKCHVMTPTEQLAVIYFCHLFWTNRFSCEWDEVVRTIKLKY